MSSLLTKPAGYAIVKCHYCPARLRVEIGADPEGWVRLVTLRGKPIATMWPRCAGDRINDGVVV